MRCLNCSADIPEGSQVCVRCGVPASAPATAGPAPAGPAPAGGPQPAGPAPAGLAPAPPSGPVPGIAPPWQPPAWPPPAHQGYPPPGLPYPQWTPLPGSPYGPAAAGYVPPGPAAGAAARDWQKVTAGILAILGGVLVVAASAIPFVTFGFGSSHQSASIFNPGPQAPASAFWFVVEPAGIALLAIAGGILLLAVRRGWLPLAAGGMLAAFGVQTFFLFLGYAFGYDSRGNQMGAGGLVGLVAGIVLAVAGVIGLAGQHDPVSAQSPAAGPNLPPAGAATGVPPYPPA